MITFSDIYKPSGASKFSNSNNAFKLRLSPIRETGRVLSIFERQVSVFKTEDKPVQHSIHHVGSSSLVIKWEPSRLYEEIGI